MYDRGTARDASVECRSLQKPTSYRVQSVLDVTLSYHQRSKHFPFQFAPSVGYMDWDTQPDPFRRFEGARTFPLEFEPVGPLPRYEPTFVLGQVDPTPVNAATVARLFYDRWRCPRGRKYRAPAGRCVSTRRAETSIPRRLTWSVDFSQACTISRPFTTTRRWLMR